MSSDLQNKLLRYEEKPPLEVWVSLSAALDEAIPHTVLEKMAAFEAMPPVAAWEKICRGLGESEAPLPFLQRYRRPLKYSAAAAILVFAAVLTTLLVSKRSVSEVPAATAALKPAGAKNSSPATAPGGTHAGERTAPASSWSSRLSASLLSSGMPSPVRTRQVNVPVPQRPIPSLTATTAAKASAITSDERMDLYMVYADEDGHALRLPKKLFDAFACPPGHALCREKLRSIQQQMASAALTNGFTAVLEMLDHLKENQ